MTSTVAMRGQVTIPKAAREKLGITPGTELEFSVENGRLIATKVVKDHPALKLMGRHSQGRRTDEIMADLRGNEPAGQ